MLCDICVGALQHRKGFVGNVPEEGASRLIFVHHKSSSSLTAAATLGCQFCQPFWEQLSEDEQVALRYAESESVEKKRGPKDVSFDGDDKELDFDDYLTICMLMTGTAIIDIHRGDYIFNIVFSSGYLDLGRVTQRKDPALGYYVLQPILDSVERKDLRTYPKSHNTSSDECWTRATEWLNRCLSTHSSCKKIGTSSPWYPTRLLSLEWSDQPTEANIVKLIHTASDPPVGPFTTLSHCWGKGQFLQLLKMNVADFEAGTPVSRMPKTFQDAIAITRRLGMKYIWIDSLCIFQDKDDLSDWHNEASVMHNVYSNSYLNISASAAVDSSEGLFFARDPKRFNSADVSVCLRDLQPDEEVGEYAKCEVVDFMFWQHNMAECHINKRGWVLQERLLAPRVLHFGRHELLWECREFDACETYPYGLPDLLRLQTHTHFKSLDPTNYTSKLRAQGRESEETEDLARYMIWDKIVRAYSETLLTVPRDKLVAISGIAKRMKDIMDDEYVAGLWRSDLLDGLLWHVPHQRKIDGSPSSRPEIYRAPSWSWTSVDGVVTTMTTRKRFMLASVVDVYLDYVTNDNTGLIKGGHCDLRGCLKAISLEKETYEGVERWHIKLNGEVVRRKDEGLPDWERLGPQIFFDIPPPEDDIQHRNQEKSIYFMPIRESEPSDSFLWCLLLVCDDRNEGLFRRLGVVASNVSEEKDMLMAEVPKEDAAPCRNYEEGLHTIRIV